MTNRDELAMLLVSPMNNPDNKYGDHLSFARCHELADAILARYDLHPKGCVVVPAEDAALIDRAFLPRNPNKMRNAAPEVAGATRRFKAAVLAARPGASDE